MKEKLLNALGDLGGILYFVISAFVYVLPIVMIGKTLPPNRTTAAYPAHGSVNSAEEDPPEITICKPGVSICVMSKSLLA